MAAAYIYLSATPSCGERNSLQLLSRNIKIQIDLKINLELIDKKDAEKVKVWQLIHSPILNIEKVCNVVWFDPMILFT